MRSAPHLNITTTYGTVISCLIPNNHNYISEFLMIKMLKLKKIQALRIVAELLVPIRVAEEKAASDRVLAAKLALETAAIETRRAEEFLNDLSQTGWTAAHRLPSNMLRIEIAARRRLREEESEANRATEETLKAGRLLRDMEKLEKKVGAIKAKASKMAIVRRNKKITFHLFPRFPPEIRRNIWVEALPASQAITIAKTNRIEAFYSIPTIFHVCLESREVALNYYDKAFGGCLRGNPVYFKFETDLLHFENPYALLAFYGGYVPVLCPPRPDNLGGFGGFRRDMSELHQKVRFIAVDYWDRNLFAPFCCNFFDAVEELYVSDLCEEETSSSRYTAQQQHRNDFVSRANGDDAGLPNTTAWSLTQRTEENGKVLNFMFVKDIYQEVVTIFKSVPHIKLAQKDLKE